MLCTFFIKTGSWKNVIKTSVMKFLFVKTSGKSSGILLNITLHKKCFLALISYNNESINIGKKAKCCLYLEVGLHWQSYQMDVNLRRTSKLYKKPTMKKWMIPKQREKGGKQGSFTYNYIFDAFCDLKLLASLRNFKTLPWECYF